jgi:hypothetical protein
VERVLRMRKSRRDPVFSAALDVGRAALLDLDVLAWRCTVVARSGWGGAKKSTDVEGFGSGATVFRLWLLWISNHLWDGIRSVYSDIANKMLFNDQSYCHVQYI